MIQVMENKQGVWLVHDPQSIDRNAGASAGVVGPGYAEKTERTES